MKAKLIILFLLFSITIVEGQKNVGIGIPNPQEKLDVAGAIKIDTADTHLKGTLQFREDRFYGNVNGLASGWRLLDGPWRKNPQEIYFYAPANESLPLLIGDSLVSSPGKLFVRRELGFGGSSVHGIASINREPVAEGFLGHQYSDINPFIKLNFGVLGNVYDDAFHSLESYGVAGNNMESDSINYGGYFISQGSGDRNIGVYGLAFQGQDNWAGFFEGKAAITQKLGIATESIHQEATVHMKVTDSGNYPHFRIESPSSVNGFGITFQNPLHEFYVAQNLGNFNDGRFQIAPAGSFNWFTMLQNGDVGLIKSNLTPFARLQIAQKGSLNNEGLQIENAGLFIGESQAKGMAFDENQIECIGEDLYFNFNSLQNVRMVEGGGKVGIGTSTINAKLHVGEGHTVLFGKDTLGKANFYPDAKLMFKPGKGGAFRVGQLNADGSLIGGTGYNYWDPSKVGWASVAIGNNTLASGAGAIAVGIRAHALNFGSVALGHLSRTKGNSAVAAGYYTRADAFVSTAVGSCNTGGGNSNEWFGTDPIFEVGNSLDTSNRHNALTVMKNGRVGINHSNPQSMLDIEQPNPGVGNGVLLNLAGIGHWETSVDNARDYNFYFNNILKGYIRDDTGDYIVSSDRRLKEDIEPIENVLPKLLQLTPSAYRFINTQATSKSYGFIAQEVQPLFPNLVTEKNGYLGMDYKGFSILAVKAIQELSAQNELIQNQLNAQQELLEQLQKEIELLKQKK